MSFHLSRGFFWGYGEITVISWPAECKLLTIAWPIAKCELLPNGKIPRTLRPSIWIKSAKSATNRQCNFIAAENELIRKITTYLLQATCSLVLAKTFLHNIHTHLSVCLCKIKYMNQYLCGHSRIVILWAHAKVIWRVFTRFLDSHRATAKLLSS